MMQRKKNIRLILAFCILVCSAMILALTGKNYGRSDLNDTEFMLEDTASISRIDIEGKSFTNSLERVNGRWMVNKRYLTDASMIKVLMAVLHEVRVHRKAPKQMTDEITENLISDGFRITIYYGRELARSFIAGGNGTSISYFMDESNEPFVVHLPGYNSYVSGIFEVSENDWRERLIVSTSWSGLKMYSLDYPGKINDGFTITSSGLFPAIIEVSEPDTAIMMGYLEQLEYFAADQFISAGALPEYDSLAMTTPWAVINIDAVSLDKQAIVKFFKKLPDDPLILAIINDTQSALFSYERIKGIFVTRPHFENN